MSSFSENIRLTFIRQIATLLIGGLAIMLVARILGAEEQGKYAILILVPLTLFNLLNFGYVPGTIYWVGQGKHSLGNIHHTNMVIALWLSAVAAGLGLLSYFCFKESYLSDIPFETFCVVLISLPFLFMNYFTYSVFQGVEDFRSYNTLIFVNQSVFMACLVASIVLLELELWGAALSFTVSQVATSVFGRKFLIERQPTIVDRAISWEYAREGFRYGIMLWVCNVLAFINYRADLFLIAWFMDFRSVGLYALSVSVVEKSWIIPAAVANVLFARVANTKDDSERDEVTSVSTRNMLPIMALACVGIFCSAELLLPLIFGSQYTKSVQPLLYLLPGILFASIAKTVANDFAGRGQANINARVAVFTVLINITLNFLLIPTHGLIGAASATSISYTFNAITKLCVFCRLNHLPLSDLLLVKRRDIALYRSLLIKT